MCGTPQGPGANRSDTEAGYMFATDSCLPHPPNFTLANAGRTIHVGFGLGIHVGDAR